MAAAAAALGLLAACSVGPSATGSNQGIITPGPPLSQATIPPPAPGSSPGGANPLDCQAPNSKGVFPAPPAGTQVSIDDLSREAGYKVVNASPDAQSGSAFRGYEACQYSFNVPSGVAMEQVYLVVGTNPIDSETAADEYATTESTQVPFSARPCAGNGCSFHFTDLPGVGEAAIKGISAGTEVIAARSGDAYVEIGPGSLGEPRMINLAQFILSAVH
ncbi:MAG TPA: hypothetical protein VFW71_04135 [Actinomycetota bacterium]|nr:hypothetical protein [Actinomycetota bacterium]